MLLAPAWQADSQLPPQSLQGGVLLSGLYDLEPVQRCVPNTWLNLSVEEAKTLSPIYQLPDRRVPLYVAVAEQDTDEFKRQSKVFASACSAQGNRVMWHEAAQRNHFNIVLDWMNPQSDLFQSSMALIRE